MAPHKKCKVDVTASSSPAVASLEQSSRPSNQCSQTRSVFGSGKRHAAAQGQEQLCTTWRSEASADAKQKRKSASKDTSTTSHRHTRGMSTDATRKAVFNTSELLDSMLVCLSAKTLFCVQRACHSSSKPSSPRPFPFRATCFHVFAASHDDDGSSKNSQRGRKAFTNAIAASPAIQVKMWRRLPDCFQKQASKPADN